MVVHPPNLDFIPSVEPLRIFYFIGKLIGVIDEKSRQNEAATAKPDGEATNRGFLGCIGVIIFLLALIVFLAW